eukprot:NODE_283_length_11832_cov_0.293190.p8 type:complete len:115 gc:universal NODE_283_length_11832_cov_0.293190:2183-1839(-)
MLDFVPQLKSLPKSVNINFKRKELQEYVLKKSAEQIILSPDFKQYCTCKKPLFLHQLQCSHCSMKYQMCIVSGTRICEEVKCTSCQHSANVTDWNKFIKYRQRCPYCASPETFK